MYFSVKLPSEIRDINLVNTQVNWLTTSPE